MFLLSSSLLSMPWPAHLVCLIGGIISCGCNWPYTCIFCGIFLLGFVPKQYITLLAKWKLHILMKFPFSLFSMPFINMHVVPPYGSIVIVTTWKKSSFYNPRHQICMYSIVSKLKLTLPQGVC